MATENFIIADAGGTKTMWLFSIRDSVPVVITTRGINASVSSDADIIEAVMELKLSLLTVPLETGNWNLFFFGAGCNSLSAATRLADIFREYFPISLGELQFFSDIEGAARALYGRHPGLVCIIGTGSATGLYDGNTVIDSVPSLGYVLGDEGSGASLGKGLLNMVLKRGLCPEIKEKLEVFANIDIQEVLYRVYRCGSPNTYLASFVPFIKKYEEQEQISSLIDTQLKLFFTNNVLKYKVIPNNTLRFVGGVASLFSDRIIKISEKFGLNADKFVKNPIYELDEFYKNNQY